MMANRLESALSANRETATKEFKEAFDIYSQQDWCEIIKDIIAIANTDGGVVIFGLDSLGIPKTTNITALYSLDPADFTNKVYRYTGYQFSELQFVQCEKSGTKLFAIVIQNLAIPVVFEKPGTYDIGDGKQRTAFSMGTVYFRHGAKREPGSTDDLKKAVDRRVEDFRKDWLPNVTQVIDAPIGSTFLTIPPSTTLLNSQSRASQSVRLVDSPNRLPIYIKEEDILNITPYDYKTLTSILRERYSGFTVNSKYYTLKKSFESNSRYCTLRYLDPKNQQGLRKCFCSPDIIYEFDKHYILRQPDRSEDRRANYRKYNPQDSSQSPGSFRQLSLREFSSI